jgi:hypothetical protein
MAGPATPTAAWPGGGGRLGTARTRWPHSGDEIPRPRTGWYAYRVTGPAELPPWAAEIALTIERPAGNEPDRVGAQQVQAMVLLRVPGKAPWLAGVAEAIAEIERAAGLDHGECANGSRLFESMPRRPETDSRLLGIGIRLPGSGTRLLGNGTRRFANGSRLLVGPALPGLVPVGPEDARARLEDAGGRGLPAPPRRWRPATEAVRWRSSAGGRGDRRPYSPPWWRWSGPQAATRRR